MSDHEISEYCKEKFRQWDEHMKETPAVRENVTMTCQAVGWLTKRMDAFENSSATIKAGFITIAFAIVLQVGGFIYFWGTLNKQVDVNTGRLTYLEEIHPRSK